MCGECPYRCAVEPYQAIAFGIDLRLTPTDEGGRSSALLNLADRRWPYRPNWGLPSMVPPDQIGAPVLGFARDEVRPGENVRAVIVTLSPETVEQWKLEVEPGVVLPMYEGARVCGHGTVLWRCDTALPFDQVEEQRFRRWLADSTAPPA